MIKSFTDLRAWQQAHRLAITIYKLTDNFPQSEQFSLTSQLRRAATSVSSNIAEGFGRDSQKNKEHFYVMASGSLYEVKSQLLLAKDLGYIDDIAFNDVSNTANQAHKTLNALLKAHRA